MSKSVKTVNGAESEISTKSIKKQNRIIFESFELEKLVAKSMKTNAIGGKSVPIGYIYDKECETMFVQTPRMLTFGIDKFNANTDLPPTYSITFSFIGMENDEKIKLFYNFLEKLDSWGKEVAFRNSWEWLGSKNISMDIIKANYNNNIKIPLDKSGNPSGKPHFCKFKLRKLSNEFTTTFFTKDKVVIDSENIDSSCNKGSYARALLECNGFWVVGGKMGISWKVKQMVVEPRVDFSREYAFTD